MPQLFLNRSVQIRPKSGRDLAKVILSQAPTFFLDFEPTFLPAKQRIVLLRNPGYKASPRHYNPFNYFPITDACRPALWADTLINRRALSEARELARSPVACAAQSDEAGRGQRNRYLQRIDEAFHELSQTPEKGQNCDDISYEGFTTRKYETLRVTIRKSRFHSETMY